MIANHCMSQLESIPVGVEPSTAGGAVIYRSCGAVLVVGDGVEVLDSARSLATQLKVLAFAPGLESAGKMPSNLTVIGGRVVAVTGHLGRFRAYAAIPGGGQRDIAPFSPNADGAFDLVLDLSVVPLVPQAVPPHGYFKPRDAADIAAALVALPGLAGTFRKPRFFNFDAQLCAHGAKGLTGCTRCIEVCDAGAIRSAGAAVSIDPYLCQGCATCTLACPTGAVTFAAPSRQGLVEQLHAGLAGAAAKQLTNQPLVVHTSAGAAATRGLTDAVQTLEVPALPAFGDELWLVALAAGARSVLLVDDPTLTERARSLLRARVTQTQTLLEACGRDPGAIALVGGDGLAPAAARCCSLDAAAHAAPMPAGSTDPGKRATAITALAALAAFAGNRPAAAAPLPGGATFGAVLVDRQACTVCLACTHLCPTGALVGQTEPQLTLSFLESACVQCGLCVAGCPEHAIALAPRLDPAAIAAPQHSVVAEDDMLACTECGARFISRKVLMRSVELLQRQPAFAGISTKMLSLCMECRARSMF